MRKNNSILLIAVIAVSSCTQKSPETLLSRWEEKSSEFTSMERTLASSAQGVCLKDNFTVDILRNEVKELEKKYASSPKVTGNWKHLDLSKLPVPQANFLKAYGSKLGDLKSDTIDYSTCQDVPCIYNKIYGKEDGKAGYVHYLWYLRFGHMLSADNVMPSQASKTAGEYNGKVHELSKYLYDDKELYGMWRLSLMLKAPQTTLNYLKEVQRAPRGEGFENSNKNVCGLASSAGWIQLNDGCLSVYNNQDTGYLYHAVTHELNHHVDYEQGRGSREFYRSHKKDYLDLSGFWLKEYVDEKTGKPVREWQHHPGIKLISSYAGGAPQENYAETLALYRVDGDHTKSSITEAHFNWTKTNYYAEKSFEKEAMLGQWTANYGGEIGKAVFKAVVECSQETKALKSNYFTAKDFSVPVLPSILNCIGIKAPEISNLIKARISLSEPEGCGTLNDPKAKLKWEPLIKDVLRASFDKYLQELNKDKEYIARIQLYQSELSDKKIARESYLKCYGESDEEACFNQEILAGATDKALTLMLPEAQTKEMAEMYVSYHSYSVIKDEMTKSYREIVSSRLESIRQESDKIWEECSTISHNDDEQPSGRYFQVSSGYMISSFYNCLNARIPDSLKDIVRNFSVDGLKLQHAKEEVIILREVQPHLVSMLKENYEREKVLEAKKAEEFLAEEKGNVRRQLLANFDWVKNVVDTEQIQADCLKHGLSLIDFQPLYALKKDLFGDYVSDKACFNMTSTKEFNSWLDNSKGDMIEKAQASVETELLIQANARADNCLKQFPMDTVINKLRFKKQREACLVDEWPKLEEAVLTKAGNDPIVKKFQISKDVLRVKVESNRRRLQLRIIKEKFN